jgi:hypothetical protein
MDPMYLHEVENSPGRGEYAELTKRMEASGAPIPQIFHLFKFKPAVTDHLSRFSQAVMRGPSPLSPGIRELIAAFTSKRNQCPF